MPCRFFISKEGNMARKRDKNESLKKYIISRVSSFLGQLLFLVNSYLVVFKNVNHPNMSDGSKYVFASWHSQLCGSYAILNRENVYYMISGSRDGDIVAEAGGRVGINAIRGSSKRGGATAALEMIDKVKNGASAYLAVDGPRGPVGVVKKGCVEIAKLGGAKIVPMAWKTTDWFTITVKSWDKLQIPILYSQSVALYGEPIEVPADANEEQMEEIRLMVEKEINRVNEDLNKNFRQYYKTGIHNRHKSKSVVSWF